MNAEVTALCDRLVGAVVNGGVQGLLLLLFVALSLRVLRGTNAATRSGIEFATLVLLAILPGAHFFAGPALFPAVHIQEENFDTREIERQPPSVLSFTEADEVQEVDQVNGVSVPVDTLALGATTEPSLVPTNRDTPLSWRIPLPRRFGEILVMVWAVVTAARLAFLTTQVVKLRAMKRDSSSVPEGVLELFSSLCVELKVSRAPQLRTASPIRAPIAVGYRAPAVLLPEHVATTPNPVQLEQILRHELAHVLRRDDWTNLIQQVIHSVFFFHPGVIWLCRRITAHREIACDDHVVSRMGRRKAYALALTGFAGRGEGRQLIAASAGWSSSSQLNQRIDMILDTKRNSSPRLARTRAGLLGTAAIIAAVLGFQALPRLAFAESDEAPPAEPAEPVSATPSAPLAPPAADESDGARPVVRSRSRVVFSNRIGSSAPEDADVLLTAPGPASSPGAMPAPHPHVYIAGAPGDDGPEGGGPRVKFRARGGDESLERRLDRLERLVETLARRDAEKKDFQFEFRDKFNRNFNADKRTINSKALRDAENMVEEMQKRGDFDRFAKLGTDAAHEGLKAQRKALEEQKQALERQMRMLDRQMENLEREHKRMEEDRAREDNRRERDEKRHESDKQKERDEESQKEKDAPKP